MGLSNTPLPRSCCLKRNRKISEPTGLRRWVNKANLRCRSWRDVQAIDRSINGGKPRQNAEIGLMIENIVVPLHKKNSTENPDNYRPVSILPLLSKVLEKHVFDSFYEFLSILVT